MTRVFIVGNGPSLNETPLELINQAGAICFGVNYVHKFYDRTDWRPTDFAMLDVNYHGERDYAGAVRFNHEAGRECWVYSGMQKEVLRRLKVDQVPERMTFLDRCQEHRPVRQSPISDPADRPTAWHEWPLMCFWGGSVLGAAQIATHHYRAKEIVFVGCDLGFTAWPDQETDPNHMVKDYVDWNDEHAQSIKPWEVNWVLNYAHEICANECAERGVKVWNATRGGELEIHERRRLESLT